ncbi:MAG: hypothetical protein AABZ31_09625 [Bdellovibrionota bacterium]
MKFLKIVLPVALMVPALLVGLSAPAPAAIKNLSDSVAKATAKEKSNLGKLLTDISLAPAVDPATGKNVMVVGSVAKGSVYERTGIKAGDLVVMDDKAEAELKKKVTK